MTLKDFLWKFVTFTFRMSFTNLVLNLCENKKKCMFPLLCSLPISIILTNCLWKQKTGWASSFFDKVSTRLKNTQFCSSPYICSSSLYLSAQNQLIFCPCFACGSRYFRLPLSHTRFRLSCFQPELWFDFHVIQESTKTLNSPSVM